MDHLMELRNAVLPGPYGAYPPSGGDRDENRKTLSMFLDTGTSHVILGNRESDLRAVGAVLTGREALKEGDVRLDGSPAAFLSPADALARGCASSLGVFDPISVMGHVRLLYPGSKPLRTDTGALLDAFLPGVDPNMPAAALPPEGKLALQLFLSAVRGDRLLVLEDPLRDIPPAGFDAAARSVDRLTQTGCCVAILTRRPRHARIGTRLTVVKDGEAVFDGPSDDADIRTLEAVLGSGGGGERESLRESIPGGVVLEVRGLSARPKRDRAALRDVSFEIREGEITGLCAMKGEGGERLLSILAGLERFAEGRVRLNGNIMKDYDYPSVHRSVRYIPPPSPVLPGPLSGVTVTDSLAMQCSRFSSLFVHGMLRRDRLEAYVRFILKEYPIGAEADTLLSSLDAADLRMLLEAPELDRSGSVLLLSHPGEGLTGDGLLFLRRCLKEEKVSRTGIMYLTDQVDEAMAVCDRVLVMYGGSIVFECDALNASRKQIALAMSGHDAPRETVLL
ncbi:MAG: ATP-binding cassette domain-containing protein [Clostridia bacterium]|nr:ATP-binding cassette domain-containing protein [Clostridia bacterium]